MTHEAPWRRFEDAERLFLIRSWELDQSIDRRPHHAAHLDWLVAGHDSGQILLSGPSRDRALGIYLVRADTEADARSFVATDPYHELGIRAFDVVEWEIQRRTLAAGLVAD